MRKLLTTSILGTLGAVSSTTTYTTNFIPVDSFNGYMIQIVWTGSPVATISLLESADLVPSAWYDAVLDTVPQPTHSDTVVGSAKSTTGINILTYNVNPTNATWVALKWVNASSSGTITSIQLVAKGVQT